MITSAVANETLLKRLNLAIMVVGAVIAVTAGGLGFGLLLAKNAESDAYVRRTSAIAAEKGSDATIASGRKVPRRKVPARADQQIEMFGSALADACHEEGVTFSAFDNSGDAGPFASRYGGPAIGKEWKGSEARVTIRGQLADIYTVLGKLKGHPVPFEVEAGMLDSAPGDQQVRVALTIAAVVREEPKAKGETDAGR